MYRASLDPLGVANMALRGDGSQLVISNSQVDDAATYTCHASNPAGQAQRNFRLDVLGRWMTPLLVRHCVQHG